MGCSAGGGFSMLPFGWGSHSSHGSGSQNSHSNQGNHGTQDARAKLERKLCLARDTPDAIFDLSECAIKAIPSGVFSLCRVFRKEALNLRDNLLSTMAEGGDISDLYLIQVLDISINKFQKLPDNFGSSMVNLREFHASNNRLKSIPDSIGNLINLRLLNLSDNLLKNLPSSLGRLVKLNSIDVSHNPNLKSLPKELCGAINLTSMTFDIDNVNYPPDEISQLGTVEVIKFFCRESGKEYVEPIDSTDVASSEVDLLSPIEYNKSLRSQLTNWEEQDENMHRLENEMHEANKRQKERFLEEYSREQKKLDFEFNKIQNEKDIERLKLIKEIQDEERSTEEVVVKLLQINLSNPQHVQQLLEHDQKEHDRLLEMCRTQYTDLKKTDTLKAMESLLQEEYEYEKSLKAYGETQSEVKQSFLIEELNANYQLSDLLKIRDREQYDLIRKLLKDENMQKAAVGALLEKCDARTWGLVQEISLVESHLAKLSSIELDRRKLELDDNMENLAEQRIKLSLLLVDLLDQQESRRSQLLETLQAMEKEKKTSSDFWLIRYQQLLESVPSKFISSQQQLDPILANYLLQEGVIHCLPFLIHWVSSKHDLENLNNEMLMEQGLRLSADRDSVLKAIRLYLEELDTTNLKLGVSTSAINFVPSAPPQSDAGDASPVEESVKSGETSECVVCMENSCAVVFIPCGHLCCCMKCSDSIEHLCPMCRQEIERKIRVIHS